MNIKPKLTAKQIDILDNLIDSLALSIPPQTQNQSEHFKKCAPFIQGEFQDTEIFPVLENLESISAITKPDNSEAYPIDRSEGHTLIELRAGTFLSHIHSEYLNIKSINIDKFDIETVKRYINILKLTKYSPFKKEEIHNLLSFKNSSELGASSFAEFLDKFDTDLMDLKKMKVIDFEYINNMLNLYYNPLILFRFEAGLTNQLVKSIIAGDLDENPVIHKISLTKDRRILLDGEHEIGKPNFMQENDLVFDFLYNNPNKPWSKDEIKQQGKISVGKSFDKIVENLGFKGNLRKVFFNISKTHIQFNNPITQRDLLELGIEKLEY
ncbi:hypothetical protein JW978_00580 [Candidatus Dojkabacteria bacterium]|nr:hypothetical protein [Candidatus Dojkabacteria bacterium]